MGSFLAVELRSCMLHGKAINKQTSRKQNLTFSVLWVRNPGRAWLDPQFQGLSMCQPGWGSTREEPTFSFIFLKYKVIYFNWRLSGFAIHWHESATGIHVFPILKPLPPPSPSHPSGSSQCTSPKHPVSCIEPGLVIRFTYDIIHVSMPFSQIIPPCPLPQSPKDCSIHLCLFCYLTYKVIVTIFLNSIYMH